MVESRDAHDRKMIEEAFAYSAGNTEVYQQKEEKADEDIEEPEEVEYQYP